MLVPNKPVKWWINDLNIWKSYMWTANFRSSRESICVCRMIPRVGAMGVAKTLRTITTYAQSPPPSSIYDRSFPPGRDIPLSNNNRVCKIFIYDFQEVFVLTMYNVQDDFVMFTFTRFYTRKGAYKQFQNLKQVQWQRFCPSTKSEFVKSLIYLSDHITSGVFKLWARNLIVHVRVI